MNESIGTTSVSKYLDDEVAPLPPAVPGEFIMRLGEGWSGPLHDLAGEMESSELGAKAAAAGLLAWIEFIEFEVQRLEGFEGLLERLRRLRGAVMVVAANV